MSVSCRTMVVKNCFPVQYVHAYHQRCFVHAEMNGPDVTPVWLAQMRCLHCVYLTPSHCIAATSSWLSSWLHMASHDMKRSFLACHGSQLCTTY